MNDMIQHRDMIISSKYHIFLKKIGMTDFEQKVFDCIACIMVAMETSGDVPELLNSMTRNFDFDRDFVEMVFHTFNGNDPSRHFWTTECEGDWIEILGDSENPDSEIENQH